MKVIRTIRLCRWRYISRPVPATGVRVSKLYERVREARSLTKLTQEALAGELGVDSVRGQGSRFWFRVGVEWPSHGAAT